MAAAAAPGPSMVDSLQSVRRARPGDGDDVWLVVGDSSDRQVRVNWDEDLVVSCAGGSEHFVLSRRAAVTMSAFLKDFTADESGLGPGNAAVIPVDFSAAAIQNVVCFMEYHVDVACLPIMQPVDPVVFHANLLPWDLAFLHSKLVVGGNPENHMLCVEVLNVANFLCVPALVDLTASAIASIMIHAIQTGGVERMRDVFKITNDLSPDEEAAIESQNAEYFKAYPHELPGSRPSP